MKGVFKSDTDYRGAKDAKDQSKIETIIAAKPHYDHRLVTWFSRKPTSLISLDSRLPTRPDERYVCLFRAIFGGWTPPQHIFLMMEMAWDLFKVSEKYRFYVCARPGSSPKNRPNIRMHTENPVILRCQFKYCQSNRTNCCLLFRIAFWCGFGARRALRARF